MQNTKCLVRTCLWLLNVLGLSSTGRYQCSFYTWFYDYIICFFCNLMWMYFLHWNPGWTSCWEHLQELTESRNSSHLSLNATSLHVKHWIIIGKRFTEESTETFKPVWRVGLLWLHLWLSFMCQLRRPTSENNSDI